MSKLTGGIKIPGTPVIRKNARIPETAGEAHYGAPEVANDRSEDSATLSVFFC